MSKENRLKAKKVQLTKRTLKRRMYKKMADKTRKEQNG